MFYTAMMLSLPEAVGDVGESALFYAVESLVGSLDIQWAALGIVGACLQVVEVGGGYLRRQLATATVPCYAHLGVLPHPAGQLVNPSRVLVASHQAETCHANVVLQHGGQSLDGERFTHIGP